MNRIELLTFEQRPCCICRSCSRSYTVYDAAVGYYDAATATCHACFEAMAKDPSLCFAKEYDGTDVQCQRWCEDREVCQAFERRKREMKLDRARKQRLFRIVRETLAEAKKRSRALEKHPFPIRTSVLRVAWELAIRGTTIDRLRQFCEDVGADFRYVMRELRRGAKGRHRWHLEEDGNEIRIVYEGAVD